MTGRPINLDRERAVEFGLMTYTGTTHRRCGTNIRYVSGGGCVHCARLISTEQRNARKYMLAHPEVVVVNDAVTEPLDNVEEDVVDEVDAAKARFEESIAELM